MSRQGAYDDINNPTWYRRSSWAEREAIYAECRPSRPERRQGLTLGQLIPPLGDLAAYLQTRHERAVRRSVLDTQLGGAEKIRAEYLRLRAEAATKDTDNGD
jgi:hypothetical protein